MKKIFRCVTAVFIVAVILVSTYIPVFAVSEAETTTETETTTAPETTVPETTVPETTEPETKPAPVYKKGDVDCNGTVSASDARTILRLASHLVTVTEEQEKLADYNSDNKITAADARYVLRVAAKLDPYAKPKPNELPQQPITDANRKFNVEIKKC